MLKINSSDELSTLIENEKKIIILIFTVNWCPDCKFIDPFIDNIINRYNKNIVSYNIDIDEQQDLKALYDVTGIPSFIAVKNGVVINRLVNRVRKSKEEIDSFYLESMNI